MKRERKRKNPQFVARLLLARPIPWFFLKSITLMQNLRLPLS
jgi:hypothetical protein